MDAREGEGVVNAACASMFAHDLELWQTIATCQLT